MIVHTVTSGQRLLDVARLLAADLRVQVVFTHGPDVFGNGVAGLLERIGGVVVPWHLAVRHHFDLVVSAAYGGIEEVHGPLIIVPHGAGYNKRVSRRLGGGAMASRGTYGLSAQELIRDGMVIPTAVALAHDVELGRLAQSCPEATPIAHIIGDPCHDRLVTSMPERPAYRRALGVGDDRELVVVTSTWGQRSLFGQRAQLLRAMAARLPKERYRVAALLHPNVWFGHGVWQIRAWLADCVRDGLALIPPEADWRGALVAADHIVGDHGSLAVYGAVTDASIMLFGDARDDVDPESAMGLLSAAAPRLRLGRSLACQLRDAAASDHPGRSAGVVARLTSAPGMFDENMFRLMYRVLRLQPPPSVRRAEAVPPPFLTDSSVPA
ncbi:hypothetical protein [Spongiactinospora sp. TRM90649]|uniref:hypothetical protein n=1 Tax=Spongiactinospora sp. TRM90649 TaxID=3031114 RepID=UPI0023F9367F|nr:hypothetical protein [Spongiactinospora sp. TRM90649]